MKPYFVQLSLLLVALLSANIVWALPTECLQAQQRKNACPHLIYKQAALPVASLGIQKNEVVCICLSDLQALNNKAKSKIEEIEQKVTLQRIADRYHLSEQDIFTLVRH